ncbi:MAG: exodeoxyribonuclease VII large subunit [Tannerella sp.]|jgi:exodeoxyribonuclease VII large subunit|nr:exodeoxyribonuclease VII large subunit [Tannerella sp.]
MDLFNELNTSGALTLSALNERVTQAVDESFPEACWMQAETSDVRVQGAAGHCYLEFVEKDAHSGQIVAKARGTIWARTFQQLKPYFEEETGQAFVSGLKVLVKVTVVFHKLYGYSLNVIDVEPSYTLGDLVRKRQEIIRRLQEEGIFDLNRELPFPVLPQRIAVITSPNAAGYGDFENQLMNNPAGYPFYMKLFPAIMQGEKTEESVVAALDRICRFTDCFDVVVLIRGGGSASDLNCFDSYLLAAHCAQFPLPVITGIGHERDDSIVDLIAHTRLKTPTAVAAFLIGQVDEQAGWVNNLQQTLCSRMTEILSAQQTYLKLLAARFPSLVMHRIEQNRTRLQALRSALPASQLLIMKRRTALTEVRQHLQNRWTEYVGGQNREMELTEQFLKMASPDYVLQRGYTLILKDGKIVKRASGLSDGDEITARFADGDRTAIVRQVSSVESNP